MSTPPLIFDRTQLLRQRKRAFANFAQHDFLLREAAERLGDRMADITRRFSFALDVGGRMALLESSPVQHILPVHSAASYVPRSGVVCDEEWLPFGEEVFDAVFSVLYLHYCNDILGTFIQLHRSLKPDGLLLLSLYGGQTLQELRTALEAATLEVEGGLRPYVAPFLEIRDAGMLLSRAGFALPVVDSETITVSYDSLLKLLKDVRGMGEANVLSARAKRPIPQRVLKRAEEIYREQFSDEEGRLLATFEIVTLTAWTPHASQPKPLERGSGQVQLQAALSALKE